MLCATAAASDLICTECGDDVNSVSLFRELAACWQTEDEEEEESNQSSRLTVIEET